MFRGGILKNDVDLFLIKI